MLFLILYLSRDLACFRTGTNLPGILRVPPKPPVSLAKYFEAESVSHMHLL